MKINRDITQGSLEWLAARCGKVTASDLNELVSPTGEVRKGEMPKTYLYTKLAEWASGVVQQNQNSFGMEQGIISEPDVRGYLRLEYGWDIETVGFIETDDGKCGCSPDGLMVGEDCGLEIKAPFLSTHFKYLLSNGVPKDYRAQVQGCMWVTGWNRWKFVSYRANHPPLVLEVERDDEYQTAITEAVEQFLAEMDRGIRRYLELSEGEYPKRFRMFQPAETPAKPKPFILDINV